MLDILHQYERASGQQINREKTQQFFSTNTNQSMQEHIKSKIGVSATHRIKSYPSLPSFVGRGKKKSFNYLREQIWLKIQGWKEKLLSKGGREVLIKVVLQAMPTYTMGCFLLPKSLCKDIESLNSKSWWGFKGDTKKIHWLGWEKLCLPKCQGGLGYKDEENFNLALLGK